MTSLNDTQKQLVNIDADTDAKYVVFDANKVNYLPLKKGQKKAKTTKSFATFKKAWSKYNFDVINSADAPSSSDDDFEDDNSDSEDAFDDDFGETAEGSKSVPIPAPLGDVAPIPAPAPSIVASPAPAPPIVEEQKEEEVANDVLTAEQVASIGDANIQAILNAIDAKDAKYLFDYIKKTKATKKEKATKATPTFPCVFATGTLELTKKQIAYIEKTVVKAPFFKSMPIDPPIKDALDAFAKDPKANKKASNGGGKDRNDLFPTPKTCPFYNKGHTTKKGDQYWVYKDDCDGLYSGNSGAFRLSWSAICRLRKSNNKSAPDCLNGWGCDCSLKNNNALNTHYKNCSYASKAIALTKTKKAEWLTMTLEQKQIHAKAWSDYKDDCEGVVLGRNFTAK